ncbi:MAG: hypothetical protein PVG19_09430, partial [Desulfobacterales bacterium]
MNMVPSHDSGFRIYGILIRWKNPEPGPFLACIGIKEQGPRILGFKDSRVYFPGILLTLSTSFRFPKFSF